MMNHCHYVVCTTHLHVFFSSIPTFVGMNENAVDRIAPDPLTDLSLSYRTMKFLLFPFIFLVVFFWLMRRITYLYESNTTSKICVSSSVIHSYWMLLNVSFIDLLIFFHSFFFLGFFFFSENNSKTSQKPISKSEIESKRLLFTDTLYHWLFPVRAAVWIWMWPQ